ncbi:MAG: TetR/AcrR family transcriptional regulator [Halobacteriota archaeon]
MIQMSRLVPEYKEEAKNRILGAAREAFSEKGYDQTTMEDVAHKIGVSKGALYLYFPSKEELFRAITEQAQNQLREVLSDSFKEGGLLKGASDFLDTAMSPQYRPNLYLTFEFLTQASRNDELRNMLKEDHDNDLSVVRAFLEGQRAQGIIRSDIDIRSLSFGIIGLYYGLRAGLMIGDDASDIKRAWVNTIKAMICPVPKART